MSSDSFACLSVCEQKTCQSWKETRQGQSDSDCEFTSKKSILETLCLVQQFYKSTYAIIPWSDG